ncbi:MAG: acyl-CoA thioesterase [Verrucomicrobiales bacterium]|nr:acyl-CoA thioesterase [Verrucomicrobiales bacterium]
MNSESSFSTFETIVAVRPDDIDMNQHVHNSKFLDYVLAARFDQMERCYKMPMSAFLERGFSWFVKVAHIEHKRQLFLGDHVIVATRVSKIADRSCHVEFSVTRQKTGKISAQGWFEYVMVSTDTGRSVSIPDDILAAYSI